MRALSPSLFAEMTARESSDPFLMLITISGQGITPIHMVNNTEPITSRSVEYIAFPLKVVLPVEDGDTTPIIKITFDNVSLELIDELRSITAPLTVEIEAVLASSPDTVEISYDQLKLGNITYNDQTVEASLFFDDILNSAIPSEKYEPQTYSGIF